MFSELPYQMSRVISTRATTKGNLPQLDPEGGAVNEALSQTLSVSHKFDMSGYPGRYIADASGDYDLFGRVSQAVHIDGRQPKNVRRYSLYDLDGEPINLWCIHETNPSPNPDQ